MGNEEFAYVLDYLPKGKSQSYKSEPISQVLGVQRFTLLEVVPKTSLQLLSKVYVGEGERKEIDHIVKRIDYKELSSTALGELEHAVEKIVSERESEFVQFFNTSTPITIKRHQLELIPGMGKKHMLEVLTEREKKTFDSLAELEQRVKGLSDMKKAVVKRVVEELRGDDPKHYLFARPPTPPRPQWRRF